MKPKRRKTAIITAISISVLIITGYTLFRTTQLLRSYTPISVVDNPSLKPGELYLSSSLPTPKFLDLIWFLAKNEYSEETNFLSRICGMPGDKIEIQNGNLYVNGKSPDDQLDLMFEYKFLTLYTEKALELCNYNSSDLEFLYNWKADSSLIVLSKSTLKKFQDNNIRCQRFIWELEDPFINKLYHKPWKRDNFGPYIVPANHYFVLGDNRCLSRDSRYFGPVPFDKVLGTMLNP